MRAVNAIDAQAIAAYLIDLTRRGEESRSDGGDRPSVCSFAGAGAMTRNAGLVLRTPDGQQYQISVAKSRRVTAAEEGPPFARQST
jgi:hypothetical protein